MSSLSSTSKSARVSIPVRIPGARPGTTRKARVTFPQAHYDALCAHLGSAARAERVIRAVAAREQPQPGVSLAEHIHMKLEDELAIWRDAFEAARVHVVQDLRVLTAPGAIGAFIVMKSEGPEPIYAPLTALEARELARDLKRVAKLLEEKEALDEAEAAPDYAL